MYDDDFFYDDFDYYDDDSDDSFDGEIEADVQEILRQIRETDRVRVG